MMTQIQQEWTSNSRLRVMVAIIIAILMLYVTILLSELQDDKISQLTRSQNLLKKVQNIQNEPVWFGRAKEAASLRVKYQNKLWASTSKGLAQAELQAFIRNIVDANKLSNSRITLETVEYINDPNNGVALWRVGAQVRATFKTNELQKLLWAVSSNKNKMTIRSLTFRLNTNKNSTSNFTLFVDTWFDASARGHNNGQ